MKKTFLAFAGAILFPSLAVSAAPSPPMSVAQFLDTAKSPAALFHMDKLKREGEAAV